MSRRDPDEYRQKFGIKDLRNQIFGKWTVMDYAGFYQKTDKDCDRHYWTCQCSCKDQTVVEVQEKSLKSNTSNSCGCIKREKTIKRNTKHNLSNTDEYKIWCGIKKRCYDLNDSGYKNYGGRGIKMCDRWKNNPVAFYEDMAPKPNGDYSIERIDNNKDYSPDNCKWATRIEQNNNTRNNVYLEYNGLSLTIPEWSRKINIKATTLYNRKNKGWSVEQILTTPINKTISDKQYLNSIFGDH